MRKIIAQFIKKFVLALKFTDENSFPKYWSSKIKELEVFKSKSFIEQIDILETILTRLIKANASNQGKLFDTEYNDFKKASNIIKKFESQYSFSLVRESVTGFYTKRIDINVPNDQN